MINDLNLLTYFEVIYSNLNLTKAASILHVSQPTLSYQLKRLRHEFKDQLFVTQKSGLIPTAYAKELINPVRNILNEIQKVSQTNLNFNFLNLKLDLHIAMTTYFELKILSHLTKQIATVAPNVKIFSHSLQGSPPWQDLASGEIDLAIAAYISQPPKNYFQKVLYEEGYSVVGRTNHPFFQTDHSLKKYLGYEHIKIAVPIYNVSKIDQQLTKMKKSRKIVCHINNFFTPGLLLKNSDYLLTCPNSLAETYKNIFLLENVHLKLDIPNIQTFGVWHERVHKDPFNMWLRKSISDFCKK